MRHRSLPGNTCDNATYQLNMGLGRNDKDLHRFRGFVSPSTIHASGNDGRITWSEDVICFAQSQDYLTEVYERKLVVVRRPRMFSAQPPGSHFHQKRVELTSTVQRPGRLNLR